MITITFETYPGHNGVVEVYSDSEQWAEEFADDDKMLVISADSVFVWMQEWSKWAEHKLHARCRFKIAM